MISVKGQVTLKPVLHLETRIHLLLFLMECVHIWHTNCLWCVAENCFKFAYMISRMIFIVKWQD